MKALLLTTIQGHASISEAIEKGLKRHHVEEVQSFTLTDPAIEVYSVMYRNFPWICKYSFQTLHYASVQKFVRFYTRQTHQKKFQEIISQVNPDVIISSSYGFDSSIAEWRKELINEGKKIPLYINIVVDPRTFFPTNLCFNADLNCVFDEVTAERAKVFQPQTSVAVTGWFVRPQFTTSTPTKVLREKLGLDEKMLTFLFVAGSEGEVKSANLIPKLLQQKHPIQVVLACGNNHKLKEKFDKIKNKLPARSPHRFETLPFTNEIHEYIQTADLLVGKAGPNTIFESVAALTPFFATTHVSGQEDGNLELIREFNIGYVEENLHKAEVLLKKIIAHPKQLSQFTESLQKLAEYNDHSIERLLVEIKKHLT